MTREEAKTMLPIIQAFAEGKTIQIRKHGEESYYDSTNSKLNFDLGYYSYRVKPEPKCRPFKNADECWQEMQKHQPFGWVRTRKSGWYRHINILYTDTTSFKGDDFKWDLSGLIDDVTFADGAPFGVKERA